MMDRVHIDCFTALDDIPKKDWGNREIVKSVLRKTGRFSAFEMEGKLANTVTSLIKTGEVKKIGGNYPWVLVEVQP